MANAKSSTTLKPQINTKGKIECPICGRAFYSNAFYERHLEVNHPTQAYKFKSESHSEKQERLEEAGNVTCTESSCSTKRA